MAQRIHWVPPDNQSVGSVLVYRADSTKLDSLGSRTLIDTVDAKNVDGTWDTEYQDPNGSKESIYRVRFWDGVGSSELSNPIGYRLQEQLASHQDVMRVARLQNIDVGSEIVYDAIDDATEQIYFEYGDPIRKTTVYVDSEKGITGQAYDFTGDFGPVYQMREVFVDMVDPDIVDNRDYELNYGQGVVKFTDEFIGSYQGEHVMFQWVPSIFNVLIKNMAALSVLEGEYVFGGNGNLDNPRVQYLKDKVEEAKMHIRPKGVFSTKSFDEVGDGYIFIPQTRDRKNLYFNFN